MSIQHCNRLMGIYQNFGQNESVGSFSYKALLELSKAPEPEAALSEAVARKEAGEDITADITAETTA